MRVFLALAVISGGIATGAAAQDIVRVNPFIGEWHCTTGFANTPFATLTIGNPMYEMHMVDENWQPIDSVDNGSGIMTFGNGVALPFGGPLLTTFNATGAFNADSLIVLWESESNFRMQCLAQHE
ncbi:MAG: hypothetical protein WD046_00890 [Paracoccaceae bacterium]